MSVFVKRVRALGLSVALLGPVLAAGSGGCGSSVTMVPAQDGKCSVGEFTVRTDLFFGTDRVGMAPVSDVEWQQFVDTAITPRFPDGLTMFPASGQYLQGMMVGLIKEGSKVVVLLHDNSAPPSESIEQIRNLYKAQFNQEAVLRIDSAVCVSF